MAQKVKDPALSLLRLGLQPWHRFDPWPGEFPHAMGVAKKKKKKSKKWYWLNRVYFLSEKIKWSTVWECF